MIKALEVWKHMTGRKQEKAKKYIKTHETERNGAGVAVPVPMTLILIYEERFYTAA